MFDLMNLSDSQNLLYGGIALMVLSVLVLFVFIIVCVVRGGKLKRKLEKEYGNPEEYITGHKESR